MSYIKCQCNVAFDEALMRIQLGDCTSIIPVLEKKYFIPLLYWMQVLLLLKNTNTNSNKYSYN